MNAWTRITAVVTMVVASGAASAQYPIVDMVAERVIKKYQGATCEQLWQNRGKSAGPEEQKLMGFLRSDPQMREYFFNKISGPVMNKMFECGMFP